MSLLLNETADDVVILHMGDRAPVNVGPLLRASGWRGGQFVMYAAPDVPSVGEFTVEASNGVAATGFLGNRSEDYSNPRQSTYRNYTSYQNASHNVAVAGGASVVTMFNGGGRYLFRIYETEALTGGGARTAGAAVYALNDNLRVSENGILCNDAEASILAATGGAETIFIGTVSRVPTAADPRMGLDMKF